MVTTLLVVALLGQSPPPPPLPAPADPGVEAVRPSPDEPREVFNYSRFIERNLVMPTLSTNMQGRGLLTVTQGGRIYSMESSDFPMAFRLVPEAMAVAEKAHEQAKSAMIIGLVGAGVTLLSLAASVAVPLAALAASSVSLTALIVGLAIGLVASGVGSVLVTIAALLTNAAQMGMQNAVVIHNRGLLDLRPPPAAGSVPGVGGLSLQLP